MNDNREHEDQASELKSLFDEVRQNEPSVTKDRKQETDEETNVREIDLLNLPPRNEVHGKKQQWARIRIGKPLRRLLLVILILLITFGLIFYFWSEVFIDILFHL